MLAVLAVVVEYGVLPLVGAAGGVLAAARGAAWWWFAPGIVLEAVSIAAYAAYTRALLPEHDRSGPVRSGPAPFPPDGGWVLTDGSSALVRSLDADDRAAVDELHQASTLPVCGSLHLHP